MSLNNGIDWKVNCLRLLLKYWTTYSNYCLILQKQYNLFDYLFRISICLTINTLTKWFVITVSLFYNKVSYENEGLKPVAVWEF